MMSVNIRCLSDWYVREVLILLDQSTKDVKVAYISLSCYYSFCSFRVARVHPVRTGSTSLPDYKKKNVGVYICLFDNLAYHSQSKITDRETLTWEYTIHRKVCK